jgi:hypothetical protein
MDDLVDICRDECAEIAGPSSCPALGVVPCRSPGIAWSEAVWGPRPVLREVHMSWSFVESAAALGHVPALPLQKAQ